jgi:hypothetical protein
MARKPRGRFLPEVSCHGKRPYGSLGEAQERARRNTDITAESWSAYHCLHCGSYHIGHTPQSVIAKREQRKRWRARRAERARLARLEQQEERSHEYETPQRDDPMERETERQHAAGSGG